MQPDIELMTLGELRIYLETIRQYAIECLLLENGENDYHIWQKDISAVKNRILVLEEEDLLDELDF